MSSYAKLKVEAPPPTRSLAIGTGWVSSSLLWRSGPDVSPEPGKCNSECSSTHS